jgi:predicted nucleotidyltransferase
MASILRTLDLLKKLNDAGIEYVIIGGVAAILHGSPRTTLDIDVCAVLSEPNLTRIVSMLRGLNPRFRMRPDKLPMPDDPGKLQGFKNLNLDTDLGTIDFLTEVTGVGTYQNVLSQSELKQVGGMQCRVLTLDALIAAKRAAGRMKDRITVLELEAIRKRLQERAGGSR